MSTRSMEGTPAPAGEDLFFDVRSDLERRFGGLVSSSTIDRVARESIEEFADAKIVDYVAVLATRRARSAIRSDLSETRKTGGR